MFRKLTPTMDVPLGASGVSNTIKLRRNPWISCADAAFNYGKVMFGIHSDDYNGSAVYLQQQYSIKTTAYVSFKGLL